MQPICKTEREVTMTADSTQIEGSGPAMPQCRFSGPAEFAALIRLAFAAAASEGWREIIMSDRSFEDWPLGERAVTESLNAWSRSGRKLTMLARNYDEVPRRHARFVIWRRTWAHVVDCRSSSSVSAVDFPSALWSPSWVFQRLDLNHCVGISGSEPARRVALRERLDECLRKSSPAFPSTTLGI
jgi:hypothetical protein